MSDMGYALKVKFSGGSNKLYEYFLSPDVHLSLKYLKDYVHSGHLRAVVDARGEPKLVTVIDAVPYEDRMYDGDLKPVIVLFDGVVLWEQPELPRKGYERNQAAQDLATGVSELNPKLDDDEIPF